MSMKSDQGFTLVELMIVISILAVVSVMTLPTITDALTMSGLSGAGEAVRGAFDFTRSEATTTNRAHRVELVLASETNGGELIVTRGDSSACAKGAPCGRRTRREDPKGRKQNRDVFHGHHFADSRQKAQIGTRERTCFSSLMEWAPHRQLANF